MQEKSIHMCNSCCEFNKLDAILSLNRSSPACSLLCNGILMPEVKYFNIGLLAQVVMSVLPVQVPAQAGALYEVPPHSIQGPALCQTCSWCIVIFLAQESLQWLSAGKWSLFCIVSFTSGLAISESGMWNISEYKTQEAGNGEHFKFTVHRLQDIRWGKDNYDLLFIFSSLAIIHVTSLLPRERCHFPPTCLVTLFESGSSTALPGSTSCFWLPIARLYQYGGIRMKMMAEMEESCEKLIDMFRSHGHPP